jgi:hypothetical protein
MGVDRVVLCCRKYTQNRRALHAAFHDDKVNLPIDCTLELYGNIIDSCDIFIDELYMHFLEKEFLEEALSSLGWPAHCEVSPDRWPRLVRDYALEYLYGGDSNNYGAEIRLTGIVVDLLYYRPEVCALILIRSADWWDQHRPHRVSGGTVNWSLSYEWDKHVKPVAVLDETACAEAMPLNRSVMSGVAAFHLGIQKARDLLGRSK